VECKRAEPKDATAQTLSIEQPAAGAMVLAQAPDGTVGLVPAHAFGSAGAVPGTQSYMYPGQPGAGMALVSPADIAGYRATGLPHDLLQQSAAPPGNYACLPILIQCPAISAAEMECMTATF
jgi:hypothetical protein